MLLEGPFLFLLYIFFSIASCLSLLLNDMFKYCMSFLRRRGFI